MNWGKSKLVQSETNLLAPASLLFPPKAHTLWEPHSCGSLLWAQSAVLLAKGYCD